MSDHHVDLPFSAEYAKSNRASCKACRDNIEKDTLRLAVMVQVRLNIVSSFASSFSDEGHLYFFEHTGYVTLLRYCSAISTVWLISTVVQLEPKRV